MPQPFRNVRILFFLLAPVLIVSTPLVVAAASTDDKPNIVLVVMDNFGYGEIGVYGGGELRGAPTPRIDSIAAEGFQLTNFNVEAECTPSRTSLMTGRYGIRARQRPDGPRLENGTWETPRDVSQQTRVSMSGMESPIHRIEPSGRTATAGKRMPTRTSSSPTWCRQSGVKHRRNWKCTVARSARRSTGKSPITPSIS